MEVVSGRAGGSGSGRGRGRGERRVLEREGERYGWDEAVRRRVPAKQKVVVMDVPAAIPGRAVAEEVWREKARVFGLSRSEVVNGARPKKLAGRSLDWVDWVLLVPTFLRQSMER